MTPCAARSRATRSATRRPTIATSTRHAAAVQVHQAAAAARAARSDLVQAARPAGTAVPRASTSTSSARQRMYDTMRFFTMSCADFLDEYFESEIVKAHLAGSSIIGTALGPRSPGTAYVLLHHYMGEHRRDGRRLGFRARRHGRDHAGAGGVAQASGGDDPRRAPAWSRSWCATARAAASCWAAARRSQRRIVVSNLDVKRTFLKTDGRAGPAAGVRRAGAQLQDPRLLGQAQHRARRAAGISGAARRTRRCTLATCTSPTRSR